MVFMVASSFSGTGLAQDSNSDVVPLVQGGQAPFSGLLVPEVRFVLFLNAEIAQRDLAFQLTLEKKYSTAIETTYRTALEEARPWWREPWFIGSICFVAGVAFTALSIWVGIQVVDATR
jgi:hypothetical protein